MLGKHSCGPGGLSAQHGTGWEEALATGRLSCVALRPPQQLHERAFSQHQQPENRKQTSCTQPTCRVSSAKCRSAWLALLLLSCTPARRSSAGTRVCAANVNHTPQRTISTTVVLSSQGTAGSCQWGMCRCHQRCSFPCSPPCCCCCCCPAEDGGWMPACCRMLPASCSCCCSSMSAGGRLFAKARPSGPPHGHGDCEPGCPLLLPMLPSPTAAKRQCCCCRASVTPTAERRDTDYEQRGRMGCAN